MLAKDDAPPGDHPQGAKPRRLGRYIVHRELASGGMASVWLARQRGDGDFSRVVAIKQLFPQYAKDPQFVAMFRDEARLAARIRHPNVVPTVDVVAAEGEVFIVMEYIAGESLSRLLAAVRRRRDKVDSAIAAAIIIGVLEGLHAAHQATNERGIPLKIVHRDMSPQNVIVGVDGVARVVDFGIAKAVGRQQETTQTGQLKGKICYMSPEQMGAKSVDRRCDLWAVSVVLWEMLAGRQLFEDAPAALRYHANMEQIPAPDADIPPALSVVLDRGLSREPDDRFATAREMIAALEKAITPAPTRHVAQWVQKLARDTLRERAQLVEELEALSGRMSASVVSMAPAQPKTTTVPLIRAADAAPEALAVRATESGSPAAAAAAATTNMAADDSNSNSNASGYANTAQATAVMVNHPSAPPPPPPTTSITSTLATDLSSAPPQRSGRAMLWVAMVLLLSALGAIMFGPALRRSPAAPAAEPLVTTTPSPSPSPSLDPSPTTTTTAISSSAAASTSATRPSTSASASANANGSPHSTGGTRHSQTRATSTRPPVASPSTTVTGDPLDHNSRK